MGGGIAAMAIRRAVQMGYSGEIWPVHPTRKTVEGFICFPSIDALPSAPDAAHISVNRESSIDVVRALAQRGAGGCACYAAGFSEMGSQGDDFESRLIDAAGSMPLIGPNTFGFLNYLDRSALWPYLHGGQAVERGVALISQSGNIAMNLTMNLRSVKFSHVICTGNQSVLGQGDFIEALLDDDRVSAIGMYVEGLDDLERFSRAAARALTKGVPIVVLKAGRSEASARQSRTHTSSLTGSDALHDALFKRLGVIRVDSLNRLLETLKLFDLAGPITGRNVLSLSCSGGEAALMADLAEAAGLQMKPFAAAQLAELTGQFGYYVTVSNPFDYNTSIWGDGDAQRRCFTAALSGDHDAAFLIYDHPTIDNQEVAAEVQEWFVALDAFVEAHKRTGKPSFVISTVSELLTGDVQARLIEGGVVPLQGFEDAVFGYAAAAQYYEYRAKVAGSNLLPRTDPTSVAADESSVFLDEWESKSRLRAYGLHTPVGEVSSGAGAAQAAGRIGYPVVVKAVGRAFLHKSEMGAVKLNLTSPAEVVRAVSEIQASTGERNIVAQEFLVESMVSDAVGELIVGVNRDSQFGPALVIGSGGVLVELIGDSVTLLLPVDRITITEAINSLAVGKVLAGFRGRTAGDITAAVDAVLAVAAFAEAHWATLLELDVNPLIVRPAGRGVVAADALIRIDERGLKSVADLGAEHAR